MLNKIINIFGKKSETQQATASVKLTTRIRHRRGLNPETTPLNPQTSRTSLFINLDGVSRPVVRCTAKRAYEIRDILESAFRSLPAFVTNPATINKDIEAVLRSDTVRNAVNHAIMSTGVHPDTVTRFLQNVAGRYAVGTL